MTINRRNFLRKGTLAGLSAAFMFSNLKNAAAQRLSEKPGASGLQLSTTTQSEIGKLTKEAFAKYKYTNFRFHLAEGKTVDLELIRIEVDERAADQGLDCFWIGFHGLETNLPQDTYTVDHAKLGTFRLFMVPADWDMYGVDYVAVFNRLTTLKR